jgi:hypothetical protein
MPRWFRGKELGDVRNKDLGDVGAKDLGHVRAGRAQLSSAPHEISGRLPLQQFLARSPCSLELSEVPGVGLLLVEPILPLGGEQELPQGNPLCPYQ